MFLLEEVLAYGAVLVALSVLTTLGVKQLLAGKNKTEVREEWSDNPKPTDEKVEFRTTTRGLAVVTARTIGELAGKHQLSRLGLQVIQSGENQLKVFITGQGEHVEKFIQEVKDVL